jgi:DNA polymerase/3'-5' exonuclease PolX
MTDRKQDILDALNILRQKELLSKDPTSKFKAAAYSKVAKAISTLESVTSYDDVKDIQGIGKEIKVKIQEILETGTSSAAEKARSFAQTDLLKIYGIGPTKARELIEVGITSLDELRKHPELLTRNQLLGLQHYDDLQKRIPRFEIEQHVQDVKDSIEGDITIEAVGSYRRGASDSGDIDFLVTGDEDDYNALLDKLYEDGYITEFLSRGPKKALTIAHIPRKPMRRVDFLFTSPDAFPFAVLYFTGSDQFNVDMRKHALTRGYSLSEHGLKKIRPDVPDIPEFSTEKEIFTFLGFPHKPPSKRGGMTRKRINSRYK